MFHRYLSYVFRAGAFAACLAFAAMHARAEGPSSRQPVSDAPQIPSLQSLLDEGAKQKLWTFDKKSDQYFVIHKYDSDFDVRLQSAEWKYQDKYEVPYVQMNFVMTRVFTDDVVIPPELTRAMAESNYKTNWVYYGLWRSGESKRWAVVCKAEFFLRGLSVDALADYLRLVAMGVYEKQKVFAAFIDDNNDTDKK